MDRLFAYCTNLKNVQFHPNTMASGVKMFYKCEKLENFALHQDITLISESMFEACTSLKSVSGEGIIVIGKRGFFNCTSFSCHYPKLDEIHIEGLAFTNITRN